MKFRVTWFDDATDTDGKLDGTKEFERFNDDPPFLPNSSSPWEIFTDKVQKIVDRYEDRGITIDQGGDDDWYEFNLPDGIEDFDIDPAQLLADVEALV